VQFYFNRIFHQFQDFELRSFEKTDAGILSFSIFFYFFPKSNFQLPFQVSSVGRFSPAQKKRYLKHIKENPASGLRLCFIIGYL